MKPTNYTSDGCDPISSNCVLWQGPDIECINLCKGDTVTTVVYKLATELCNLMDTLNVTNYDLSCLNLAQCGPDDFKSLIQLLIDRICNSEGITPGNGGTTPSTGCPDCEVNICSAFYYTNSVGDTVTTMQLKDYVLAIGNRVCSLIGQITTINSTLQNHENRITTLENTPAGTPQLPTITPECILTATPYDLDVVLAELEKQFCALRTATGQPANILTALNLACTNLNTADKLNGTGTMSTIPGWNSTVSTLAQSFGNMWLTICDMRAALANVLANCCDTGCGGIDLQVTAEVLDVNTIRIYFTGSVPNNYVDNNPATSIAITDAAGSGPQILNNVNVIENYYSQNAYFDVTLSNGIQGTNNIFITTTYRFIDPTASTTCSNAIQTIALGLNTCPDLTIIPSYTQATIGFSWTGGLGTVVNVELWNDAETTLLETQTITIQNTNPAAIFYSLTELTAYKVRLILNGTPCAFESFSTLEYPCVAPSVSAPEIVLIDITGTVTGNTFETWFGDYVSAHPLP